MIDVGRMIFCSIAILLYINSYAVQPVNKKPGFSGKWCWEYNGSICMFNLKIHKKNGVYYGGYDTVAGSGRFIDENERAFSFKATNEKIVTTTFQAGRTKERALIRLKILPDNQLSWRVLKYPDEELFAPRYALMSRCDNTKIEEVDLMLIEEATIPRYLERIT